MPGAHLHPITILLADDHPILRQGFKALLAGQPDFEVVGEADDGAAALDMTSQLRPDLLLLDVSMPVLGGIEVTKRAAEQRLSTRILGLTAHEDVAFARTLLEAGASGYALKRRACDELVRAVRIVAAGHRYVDPELEGALPRRTAQRSTSPGGLPVTTLSDREATVLRLITRGHTSKEMAEDLGVSPRTLETYKARAMSKLQLRTRADLVRYAMRCGWLRDP